MGRGPGGRPQGAQRPTPGHAHWQAQRPRARDSALCRGLLRPTTAHQASGRRRQLRVQPHGAMAKTTTWGAPGCAEAAVCAFKARASGPAPACPRGTVPPRPRSPVPGPRSGALPSLLVVRRHASAFCPSQLRRLTRTTADTSCVPCATRGRACARRVPGAALRAGRR